MRRPPAATHRTLLGGLAAGLAALLTAAGPARPQPAPCADEPRAAERFPFPPPLASPLEPRTRLAAVRIQRGDRERWVGQVDLGESIPFWIHRGEGASAPCAEPRQRGAAPSGQARGAPGRSGGRVGAPRATRASGSGGRTDDGGPRLAASVAGGAFSRFDLASNNNELVEVHFRVALRLLARLGGVSARAELYHVSSHLGDEFLQRTGRDPVSTSREGLEVLMGTSTAAPLRVYGGPGVLVRSTRGLEALSLRAGMEWRGRGVRWGPFSPYASAEAFAWDELGWEPLLSAEAGVAFGGGRFRLAAVAGAGPSRAEQFFREDETLWGVSFSAEAW